MLHTTNAFAILRSQTLLLVTEPVQVADPIRLLAKLALVAKKFSQAEPRKPTTKTALDAESVWRLWEEVAFDPEFPNRLQWNTLCLSPATALRPELIACLVAHPRILERLSNFLGIAYSYINSWRPHDKTAAAPEAIEHLLWAQLDRGYRTSRNRVVVKWQTARFLFTPEAANRLATQALAERVSVFSAAETLFIEPTSKLALRSLESAAEREVAALISTGTGVTESALIERWRWDCTNIYLSALPPEICRRCMSVLITSNLPNRFSAFRQELTQNITDDARLGDPRLANGSLNWRSVAEQPRGIFLSWLAERYIQLFFDIVVPKSDENRRRAEFWLRYAKRSGNVQDFQVAVSNDDMRKVNGSREARGLTFGRVLAGSAASSAFLMEFHGNGERYIIVEFSETGFAASIYRRSVFEERGVTLRRPTYTIGQLRNTSTRLDSIPHSGDWETKAYTKLAGMGIVP